MGYTAHLSHRNEHRQCQVLEVSSSAPFLGLAQESYGALPEKSWGAKGFLGSHGFVSGSFRMNF